MKRKEEEVNNQKRMEELSELIDNNKEEIKNEIVPGAYFYDTELVEKLKQEIEEMKKEYKALKEVPTKEKVQEDLGTLKEQLESVEKELKEMYSERCVYDDRRYDGA